MIDAENLNVKGLLVEPKGTVKTEVAKREAAMAALQYNMVVLLETAAGVRFVIDPAAMMATCKGDIAREQRTVEFEDEPGLSVIRGGARS